MTNQDEYEFLDEAGNISSSLAIKKHNDLITNGKRVLRARDAREVDKELARMMVDLGGLALMSIAVSGDKSFGSTIAKGITLRKL